MPPSHPAHNAWNYVVADPASTVFIGDSRHDLECGRAAGVRTAAVLWGPFDRAHLDDLEPDYWLTTPDDLDGLT